MGSGISSPETSARNAAYVVRTANEEGRTSGPAGNWMNVKGVAEQYQDINQDVVKDAKGRASSMRFRGQGAEQRGQESTAQDYWKGVQGKYAPGGPGYVGAANKSFDVNIDPGLEGYYDRAGQQVANQYNQQLASRGMYGSSAGLKLMGGAMAGLGAERANREAQFALDRQAALTQSAQAASGDELAWMQGLGSQAQAADQGWATRYGLGLQAEGTRMQGEQMGAGHILDAYGAGLEGASAAQGFRDNRIQGMFDNTLNAGSAVASGYGAALGRDVAMGQGQIDAGLAQAQDQYNIDQAQADRDYQAYLNSANSIGNTFSSIYGQNTKKSR